jgi:ribosome-binding factor A
MPKDFSRTDRIGDAIQKIVAGIIQRELKDPRLGMVTISEVKVSKDLAYAKIYVNVLPDEFGEESVKTLNKAAGFVRGLLAKQMKTRVVPQLQFVYDETTLKANKLSKLIDEACASNKKNSNQE